MHIQFKIDDDFPLTHVEVKRLVQEVGNIFRAVRDGEIVPYFKFNPDVMSILDRLHLWEEKTRELSNSKST